MFCFFSVMIRINVQNRLINSLFRYTWGYDWHSWTNLKGIPIIRKGEMLLYKGLEGKFRKHTIDLNPKNNHCRNQHSVSIGPWEKKNFEGFLPYMGMAASWSCDLDYL